MHLVHSSPFKSLLALAVVRSTALALPLQALRISPKPPTARSLAEVHSEYLFCPGPLPAGPYPQDGLSMKAVHISSANVVTSLSYVDQYGEIEYIPEREGLCSRAGCQCLAGAVVCDNFDYVFFSQIIYNFYSFHCLTTCLCSTLSQYQVFSLAGGGEVVEDPQRTNNTVNRLNPQGTAFGFRGCLAGEATGWTLLSLAKCCVGYSFHALTPQEAYTTYGVAPFASDIIASAVTIGVCLKNM